MAGTSGSPLIPSLTVGNRVFTDLTNLKILRGNSVTTNLNCTLRLAGASAGYLTSGNGFRVLAIRAHITAANGSMAAILYSDNDVGVGTSTAFTNPKYPGNDAGCRAINCVANGSTEIACDWTIPAGKYVSMVSGSTSAQVYYEVYGYDV